MMAETFRLKCECGTLLTVPVSAIGRSAHCQTCGRQFTVPVPERTGESDGDVQSIVPQADAVRVGATGSQQVNYPCAHCGATLRSLASLGGAQEYCSACGAANRIPGTGALARGAWPGDLGPPRVCDYCRKALASPTVSASRRFAGVLERKDGLVLRRQKRSTPICHQCYTHLRVMSAMLAVGSVVGIIAVGITWALLFDDVLSAAHVVTSLVLGFGVGVLCMWAYGHMSGMHLRNYWSGAPSHVAMRRRKWRPGRRGGDAGSASIVWENARSTGEFLTQALKGSRARVAVALKELPGIWGALARQIAKAHEFLTQEQASELAIRALKLECAMCRAKYPTQAVGAIISACIARQKAADKTAAAVPSGRSSSAPDRCPECGNRMVAVEFNPHRLVFTEYEDPLLQAVEAKSRRAARSRRGRKS